jgi:hypothetical protein
MPASWLINLTAYIFCVRIYVHVCYEIVLKFNKQKFETA